MPRTPAAHAASAPSSASSRPTTARSALSQQLPSIRLIPFQDSRSSRPSLSFPTITRTLPDVNAVLRIGRYSEKDAPPESVSGDVPSDAPIGFKSKVVSRKHCEFLYADSNWWIKDVKSSSGTFLNHIRLSQAAVESKPYKIKDGDILQLGIDFKGGEESIFRCVKMRILCNRGWQQAPNSFNTSAHKHLQQLKAMGSSQNTKESTTDCSICLMAIGPCQALFIAPCSHTWHFKCIRPVIAEHGDFYNPHFLCPNCRAVADLEEDIDDVESWQIASEPPDSATIDDGDNMKSETESQPGPGQVRASDELAGQNRSTYAHTSSDEDHDHDADTTAEISTIAHRFAQPTTPKSLTATSHFPPPEIATSKGTTNLPGTTLPPHHIHMPITATRSSDFFPAGWNYAALRDEDGDDGDATSSERDAGRSGSSKTRPGGSGPGKLPGFPVGSLPETEALMTPRNDAGPFVFDGAAAAQSVG